jgi:glutathione S-transferase
MIDLYTWGTPNGHKIHIMLEETGLPYRIHKVNVAAREQFSPDYVKINPNSKIPAIVDQDGPDGGPVTIFESGAILFYLAEKTGRFLPAADEPRARVLEWLMFQMGNIGPMMGQANVFYRYAPEKLPWAIQRYQRESHRLLTVLDTRLKDHEYLAGDYSIADIANWCWARGYEWGGIDVSGLDSLKRWIDQIAARPPVQRGVAIPKPTDLGDATSREKTIEGARKILA